MKALIVHAHPEPTSFTSAMKDVARDVLQGAGFEVMVSDLHAEHFNPVPGRHDFVTVADAGRFHYQSEQLKASQEAGFSQELEREQARVKSADLMVLTFPLWWGGMPAILKGWFDRVFAYGACYVDGRRFDQGLFKGRHAVMGVSTGGTADRFSEDGLYGPLEVLLYPIQRTMLEYLGLTVHPPFVAYASPRVSAEERSRYLRQWADQLAAIAPQVTAQALVWPTGPSGSLPSTDWTTGT